MTPELSPYQTDRQAGRQMSPSANPHPTPTPILRPVPERRSRAGDGSEGSAPCEAPCDRATL